MSQSVKAPSSLELLPISTYGKSPFNKEKLISLLQTLCTDKSINFKIEEP